MNVDSPDREGRTASASDVDARNDGLFDESRNRHSWMMVTLGYVRRVRRDPNSAQTTADASEPSYCEEIDRVHLYDVVDRLLISMFRDTTRYRYMRVFKNSLRLVHLLAYSLFVLFGLACDVRPLQEWEEGILRFTTAFVSKPGGTEHSLMLGKNNHRSKNSSSQCIETERSSNAPSVVNGVEEGVTAVHNTGAGQRDMMEMDSSGNPGGKVNKYNELRRKKRKMSFKEYRRRCQAGRGRRSNIPRILSDDESSEDEAENATARVSRLLDAWTGAG